ncbi:MAG: CPBP family intramembrane metalloprotease [Lachnospiraceae bacterium]|nr:CPBP family intramembrane metalloprotease [Lachnospiraceae bacterium]
MKRFIKGNAGCIGWLFLYVGIEVGVAIGLFAAYLTYSVNFKMDFLEIFSWLATEKTLSDLEYSLNMMESLVKLSDEIILPVIGISGVIICSLLVISSRKSDKKIIKKLNRQQIGRYMVIGSWLNLVITIVLYMIPERFMETYNSSVGMVLTGNYLLVVLVAGIIGPITEEVLFRYFQFNSCKAIGLRYAILATALSFGAMHGNWIQGGYAFVLGLVFAIVNNREDNLLPSIIIHITINLSSVLISRNWSNEIAGLVAYLCIFYAGYLLIQRKEKLVEAI